MSSNTNATLSPQEKEVQEAINTIFSEDWQIVGKPGDEVSINFLNLMSQLGPGSPLTCTIIKVIKENPNCHPEAVRRRQVTVYF